MCIRKTVYEGMTAVLVVAAIVFFSCGCAVQEYPAPIETLQPINTEIQTPIVEKIINPTPEPTPIVTPEPTPDLTFRTVDDIDNEAILRHQAQIFHDEVNNSNIPYSAYYKVMDEETFIIYLKWCNAAYPSEEVSLDAAQEVLDCFMNPIANEELMIIRDILTGAIDPIENANFLGFTAIMPTTSTAYAWETRIKKIKNELASLPSRERQLELAQESLNISLEYILLLSNDEKTSSSIETAAFKVCIWFDIDTLINAAYTINSDLKPQYPEWHEQYPNYIEINQYYEKYTVGFESIYYQTTENMVKECKKYVDNATPTLNP